MYHQDVVNNRARHPGRAAKRQRERLEPSEAAAGAWLTAEERDHFPTYLKAHKESRGTDEVSCQDKE